ncbi:hypothetical protein AVEN_134706-1, partial [Araneus ventricosus]
MDFFSIRDRKRLRSRLSYPVQGRFNGTCVSRYVILDHITAEER